MDIQLRESHIQLGKAVEEVASLKAQWKEKDDALMQILLLECNECEKLIGQYWYLDGMIFRKDVVIRSVAPQICTLIDAFSTKG